MNRDDQSTQDLEKDYWPDLAEYPTALVARCHAYRKVPIDLRGVDELATLLIQDIGTEWILATALEKMKRDILVEGDTGGRLLTAVAHLGDHIFRRYPLVVPELRRLIEDSQNEIAGALGDKFYRRLMIKLGGG